MPSLDETWKRADIQFSVIVEVKRDHSFKVVKKPPGNITLNWTPLLECNALRGFLDSNDHILITLEFKYGKRWFAGTLYAGEKTFPLDIQDPSSITIEDTQDSNCTKQKDYKPREP